LDSFQGSFGEAQAMAHTRACLIHHRPYPSLYRCNPNQQATIQFQLCLFHSWGSWNCLLCVVLADRCLEPSYSILALGMDRNECNASVCYGSTGHLCSICKWMVLQGSR
ncbi:hypothetical protein VIGAN_08259900, partial [Vigna angularis var. angularis]